MRVAFADLQTRHLPRFPQHPLAFVSAKNRKRNGVKKEKKKTKENSKNEKNIKHEKKVNSKFQKYQKKKRKEKGQQKKGKKEKEGPKVYAAKKKPETAQKQTIYVTTVKRNRNEI